jgi:hypothetical protein
MNDVMDLITTLGNEGASSATIVEELNRRGFRDRRKMPFTAGVVEGFMRVIGIGPTIPTEPMCEPLPEISAADERGPIVFPDEDSEAQEEIETGAENGGRPSGDYSHLGPAIYERPFRACELGPWPRHTDFRPDELEVRD